MKLKLRFDPDWDIGDVQAAVRQEHLLLGADSDEKALEYARRTSEAREKLERWVDSRGQAEVEFDLEAMSAKVTER